MDSRLLSTIVLLLIVQAPLDTKQQNENDSPIVETSLGSIQGSLLCSQYGADIFAFRGIPYAQSPTGNLRFAAPKPQGVQTLMSEDCLKLNVYTTNLTGNAPVMVYIHGGANIIGSGHSEYEAGPQYLLDHDVVMVAFNYRLGALGFMSTGTEDAPGNFGYLDQVLALKWVQQHIANFGGNPELVTIYGLSAGSMAVTLHMVSPLSKGLFHRAIAMSGSATNLYRIDNLYWTRKLARETGCPMYNPADMLNCLRDVSWDIIVNVCAAWETYHFTNMKWNYQIDGNFLEAHPTNIFLSGNFNKVPLLAGITKNELDFMVYRQENNTNLLDDISKNFGEYAPELFMYNATAETKEPPVSQEIRQFYLGNSTQIAQKDLNHFGEIFSDSIIGHGVHRLVEMAHRSIPVYYYRFDFIGERSLYEDTMGLPMGVGHADDIQYIMPGSWYGPQFSEDDSAMFMVDRMTTWWTTFAKKGAPKPEFEGQWDPTTTDKVMTLYIDRDTCFGEPPYKERFALWDELFQPKDDGDNGGDNAGDAATAINAKSLEIALFAILLSIINYH